MRQPNVPDVLERLRAELRNFETTARNLQPQPEDLPQLRGIDLYGGTLSLSGAVGGDHLIYVDFARRYNLEARIARAIEEGRMDVADNLRRCQRTAGIALIDVAGHHVTDALPAAMLHQAFLLGAVYELDRRFASRRESAITREALRVLVTKGNASNSNPEVCGDSPH